MKLQRETGWVCVNIVSAVFLAAHAVFAPFDRRAARRAGRTR